MDNDYPVVEQATAAPGEFRKLWVMSATQCHARLEVGFGGKVRQCVLDLGHSGEHVDDAGPDPDIHAYVGQWHVELPCTAYRNVREEAGRWFVQRCCLEFGHPGDHRHRGE